MSNSNNLKITPFCDDRVNTELWDNFVANHPEGRFCHLIGYKKVVEGSYRYQPYYYLLKKGDNVAGIIPFFVFKSAFLGKKLISQPFSEYGGLLLDTLSPYEYDEVFNLSRDILKQANVKMAEIHGGFGIPQDSRDKFLIPSSQHYRGILNLDTDADLYFEKTVDRMVRKAIRKAERNNVTCFEKSDSEMIKNHFYPLFLQSMKRLGVPAHPLSYYEKMTEHLDKNLKIFWAEFEGKIIAGLLGFAVGRGIHIINIVSDPVYWDKRPNDLCHWHFIKWGIENKYDYFDFGSVRYEGQKIFKEKWGAELVDYNHYLLIADPQKGKPIGGHFDSSSKTMSFFSTAWNKCVPLSMTKYLGPIIRKQLGR